MEMEEKPKENKAGKWGCYIAVLIVIILIILAATGLMNFSGGES